GRAVLHVIEQLAGIFHLGAGGGVNLQQIDKVALIDLAAGVAYAARVTADPLLAMETLGQNAGYGGLADPSGTAEQIGMMQPPLIQGVGQGGQHMMLAYHLFKRMGAPFTRQNLIAHKSRCRDNKALRQNANTNGCWAVSAIGEVGRDRLNFKPMPGRAPVSRRATG